jgi:hypothetical protein
MASHLGTARYPCGKAARDSGTTVLSHPLETNVAKAVLKLLARLAPATGEQFTCLS